jgi:enoyl-[acyl-carrier protein] reductase II
MIESIVCKKLDIKYPIIQAGMVWVSGAKLAASSANAGCLGVIGAGSMNPELLESHIKKAQNLTSKTLAVNFPLLYKDIEKQFEVALKCGIKVFITSAGSPKKYTQYLKEYGAIVIHVVSSPLLAKKCEDAGVDMVIAEGFEAGGHNGRDEITTMVLIPEVKKQVSIPVIAAGGIGNGYQIAATFALGADAVQMGTRFMMTQESSAHPNYKEILKKTHYGDTRLVMKKHIPVRLVKNKFYEDVINLENKGASKEELINLLGKGRAQNGMLLGDTIEGELEAGEICTTLNDLPTVSHMVDDLILEYNKAISVFN